LFTKISYLDNTRIKPLSVVVKEGEDVSFECHSQGTTNWSFVDPITKELNHVPNNTRVESNTLHIINVEKMNLGIYECQGHLREYNNDSQNKVIFFSRSHLIIGRCHIFLIIINRLLIP